MYSVWYTGYCFVSRRTGRKLEQNVSAVGPWQQVLVTCITCKYTVNESALSQPEILQTKYRITGSVKVIYLRISKRIHLQPLDKSTARGTVLCFSSRRCSVIMIYY